MLFLGPEDVEAKRRAVEETRVADEEVVVVGRIARNALCEGRRAVRYIVSVSRIENQQRQAQTVGGSVGVNEGRMVLPRQLHGSGNQEVCHHFPEPTHVDPTKFLAMLQCRPTADRPGRARALLLQFAIRLVTFG